VANRLAAGLWSSPPASAVLLVGALLWVGGSAWVLTDAFFVHPDPQSTIVFAVLPAVQLVAWMLVYVAARALRTPGTG